jgi:hypothetical protein
MAAESEISRLGFGGSEGNLNGRELGKGKGENGLKIMAVNYCLFQNSIN